MNNVTGVASNSGEDFVDELSSAIIFKHSAQIFGPIVKELNESDSLVDNALGGAITTLQFGIQNLVLISVTQYVISKTALVAGAVYTFLKVTNVAGKVRGIVANSLGAIPFVGRGLSGVVNVTSGFISKDRQLIAKAGLDTNSELTSAIGRERQTQTMMMQSQYRKHDNALDRATSIRNKSRDSKLSIFTHKTQTGTWTKKDKSIYENATGQDLASLGVTFNSAYVEKLNSFNAFAKDVEGKILNNAQVQLDHLTTLGYSRI
jgi:hypothetical protein